MAYPVTVTVQPMLGNRDRATTLFRFILAIPHLILVGGATFGVTLGFRGGSGPSFGAEGGLLGKLWQHLPKGHPTTRRQKHPFGAVLDHCALSQGCSCTAGRSGCTEGLPACP